MVVPTSQRSNRFRRGVLQDPTALLAQVCFHALALGCTHWQARTKRTTTAMMAIAMAVTMTATAATTPATTASAAQTPRALLRP
jgi:hypothetical protein